LWSANGSTTHRERRFDSGLFRSFDLSWDGNDNLRAINQQGTQWLNALYNGDGLRVSKQDFWTPWHHYTWGLGGVLLDTNDSQPSGTANNTIVYTPGVSQNVNGVDRFFDTDWLGSTRYLSDSTGNSFPNLLRYDAFGERSDNGATGWDPSDYQFAADWGYQTEWSASYEPGIGLQYLQQRYYDPAVGRFLSPDPLGFDAETNLYDYVENDPVNGADPFGLQGPGDDDLLLSEGQLYGQLGKQFAAKPEFKPGSKERTRYSQILDTIPVLGQAKLGYQVVTGHDPVRGRTVSLGARIGTGVLLFLGAICHFGGEGGGGNEPLFDSRPARVGHIFRPAFGHVNPASAASQFRFVRLFQSVASNSANLRADAVQAGLIAPQAEAAGVRVFTQIFRNGEQVWVTVRNGVIENAGVNLPGARR
jgi:RHS repeat-associated protein